MRRFTYANQRRGFFGRRHLNQSEWDSRDRRVRVDGEDSKLLIAEEIKSLVMDYLGEGKVGLPGKLGEEEGLFDAVTYNDLTRAGVKRDGGVKGFTLVSQARRLSSHVKLLHELLLDLSSELEEEKIPASKQRIEKLGSICGLAALPAEILVHTFSFAVYGTPRTDEPRSLSSLRLSHVCRHFRNIITAIPSFWTEIKVTPQKPEIVLVEKCLKWSKDHPLDIFLNLYVTMTEVQDGAPPVPITTQAVQDAHRNGIFPAIDEVISYDWVVANIILHASRWRSLHIEFFRGEGFVGLENMFDRLLGATLPLLEWITENRNRSRYADFDRGMGYATSWNAPALIALKLQDSLPRSLSSLSTITTFEVGLSRLRDVVSLLAMLLEMHSLSDFQVDVSKLEAPAAASLALQNSADVVHGGVQKFKFGFASADITDGIPGDLQCLSTILHKLQFPNATNIIFNGTTDRDNIYGRRGTVEAICLRQLLQGIDNRYPSARTCDFSVGIESSKRYTVSLPVHFPAGLEHLRFECRSLLSFTQKDNPPFDTSLSKLRTVKLHLATSNEEFSPDWEGLGDWIRGMVENLHANGSADGFRGVELVTEYRGNRDPRGPRESHMNKKRIARDQIISWCKSRNIYVEIRGISLPPRQIHDYEYDSD